MSHLLRGMKGAPGIGLGLGVMPSPSADIDSVPDRSVKDVKAEEHAFEQAVAAVRAELRVKRALRTFTRQRAQELAAETIDAEDPIEVHRLLNAALEQAGVGALRKAGQSRTEHDGISSRGDGQAGQSGTRGRYMVSGWGKLT